VDDFTIAALMDLIGSLWAIRGKSGPGSHPWSEAAQTAYKRALRQGSLSMSEEQALAVVNQLKIEGVDIRHDRGWKILYDRLREVAKSNAEQWSVPDEVFSPDYPESERLVSYSEYLESAKELHAQMMAEACTCPPKKSVMSVDKHPLGGSKCFLCGGSITGKFLLNQTKMLQKTRAKKKAEKAYSGPELDQTLGLIASGKNESHR